MRKEVILCPLYSPKDYEKLCTIWAYGTLEYESNYFEWWSFKGDIYRVDKFDVDEIKRVLEV